MRFCELIATGTARLVAAGIEEARGDARLLLAHAAGRDKISLLAASQDIVPSKVAATFGSLIARRLRREPVAHILGRREFWSLDFAVDHRVLCPRPDSETLIEAALGASDDRAGLDILDLGTGSGCLLLALLSERPEAIGLGIDISADALDVAKANARALGLADRAQFRKGDWARKIEGPFDLIVSNPPYIEAAALAGLEPEVRDFEPIAALVAGPDGLDAYRALAPQIAGLLTPAGTTWLEIGQGQGDAVAAIMAAAGLATIARHADLAGIERCLGFRHQS